MKIANKDWERMSDLVLSGKDGSGVAKSIKSKEKAIARFIAGTKLKNQNIKYNPKWKEFNNSFSEFADKALELGATFEEIQDIYNNTEVPDKFIDKLSNLKDKKLQNRFVGDLSRKILDSGLDIEFLPHNGYAITFEGKDAMNRNGRKWTIGYKTLIGLGDNKVKLSFDAITDEGDGPTYYVFATRECSPLFKRENEYERHGKNKFISTVMDILKQ